MWNHGRSISQRPKAKKQVPKCVILGFNRYIQISWSKAWKCTLSCFYVNHCLVTILTDPQRFFRFPREHLEDLCVRLQEENSTLRQHTRTQEQRLRRYFVHMDGETLGLCLKMQPFHSFLQLVWLNGQTSSLGVQSVLLTTGCLPSSCISVKPIQAPLLWRKGTWRTTYKSLKLVWPSSSARRRRCRTNSAWPSSTLWISGAAHHTGLVKVRVRHLEQCQHHDFPPPLIFLFLLGKTMEVEGGVRRATQTAPPHYRSVLEDTRMEMERLWVCDSSSNWSKRPEKWCIKVQRGPCILSFMEGQL